MQVMSEMADSSVDAIVTDPPYGLKFMGKEWDGPAGMLGQIATGNERRKFYAYGGTPSHGYFDNDPVVFQRWCHAWAVEALRVLKPGGHLLAFGGTRMFHRLVCALEDAGFEIRDCIMWVYGSGFPKSMNVGKAVQAIVTRGSCSMSDQRRAEQWQGWGTALKPALEPITVARKPLIGTVAENVLAHGTGAINVDGCRVATGDKYSYPNGPGGKSHHYSSDKRSAEVRPNPTESNPLGRWPANLIHDGSDEVVGLFPNTGVSAGGRAGHTAAYCGGFKQEHYGDAKPGFGDSGSAARFFYCAKASKRDRDEGCEGLVRRVAGAENGQRVSNTLKGPTNALRPDSAVARCNSHPTVKPTALMRYLCRLVTPPGGIVFDPFMGSGSTGKAAIREGFRFIGIELDESYYRIAEARIAAVVREQ